MGQKLVKIYHGMTRNGKRVIGRLLEDEETGCHIFHKSVVASEHLYRMLNAWGIDASVADDLPDDTLIEVHDKETDTTYRVPVKKLVQKSVSRHHGKYGRQYFLPLELWSQGAEPEDETLF